MSLETVMISPGNRRYVGDAADSTTCIWLGTRGIALTHEDEEVKKIVSFFKDKGYDKVAFRGVEGVINERTREGMPIHDAGYIGPSTVVNHRVDVSPTPSEEHIAQFMMQGMSIVPEGSDAHTGVGVTWIDEVTAASRPPTVAAAA